MRSDKFNLQRIEFNNLQFYLVFLLLHYLTIYAMPAFVVAPHNICNIGSKLLNAWTEQVGTSPLTFTLRARRVLCALRQ